jgi:hypothetical protein
MPANSEAITANDFDKYKSAINTQFNNTLIKSSGGGIFGEVTFGESLNSNQASPIYDLTANKFDLTDPENQSVVVGSTSGSGGTLNIYNKYNELFTPEQLAETAVHEFMHTLRIEHPFEFTQSPDTELLRDGKGFVTTENTDPNIKLNIMIYNSIIIDGQTVGDARSNLSADLLTRGQLDLMLSEIDLQKAGSGASSVGDPYWVNPPGDTVKSKK